MELKRRKLGRTFVIKFIQFFVIPISRFKKLARNKIMRQLRLAVVILAITSCIVTLVLYYKHRPNLNRQHLISFGTMDYNSNFYRTTTDEVMQTKAIKHMDLNEVYKDLVSDSAQDAFEMEELRPALIIDTPGCKIPVSIIDYPKILRNQTKHKHSCGRRAVFLSRIGHDKIQVSIKTHIVKKYLRKSALYHCCYQFLMKATQIKNKPKKIIYTPCRTVADKSIITLESDFVVIKCFEINKSNISHIIYEDIYGFSKKKNISTANKNNCTLKYNVIMLGLDSMSLPRTIYGLPRTTQFFLNNFWMSYKGYHKIEDNTFPNLMAVLSGKNLSTITKECSGRMDDCAEFMIWNTFKEIGYVTAYGEDYLRLPDTFKGNYAFTEPPTDHYMRPLFLRGETEHGNRTLVCAGKVPSGQQLLDFAFDFVDTYKKDSFFGLFWMNSFSHNANSRPRDADKLIENFLNRLIYTGAMVNTFLIFFSDHGLRFGKLRLKMEGYYDDRLPVMFIWPPRFFKGTHPIEYTSLAINQYRLITPYDLYNTLVDIKRLSVCTNSSEIISEGCPNCQSLFEVVDYNRTCQDVAIHDKWCSCHKLYPLPLFDTEGKKSLDMAVNHIRSMTKNITTQKCWACMDLSLLKLIRLHFYYDKTDKTILYYVVAFTMTPGNVSYEVTLRRRTVASSTAVIGPVSVLSAYRGLGKCAHNNRDRLFCMCQRIKNC